MPHQYFVWRLHREFATVWGLLRQFSVLAYALNGQHFLSLSIVTLWSFSTPTNQGEQTQFLLLARCPACIRLKFLLPPTPCPFLIFQGFCEDKWDKWVLFKATMYVWQQYVPHFLGQIGFCLINSYFLLFKFLNI